MGLITCGLDRADRVMTLRYYCRACLCLSVGFLLARIGTHLIVIQTDELRLGTTQEHFSFFPMHEGLLKDASS